MPDSLAVPALLDSLHVFDSFVAQHGWLGLAGACAVLFFGGFVKGAIGFALPLIALAGMGAFLPAPTAIALMVMAAMVANFWQAFAFGVVAAVRNFRQYMVLNLTLLPTIALGTQVLPLLDERVIFLLIGTVVGVFALLQLVGWRPPDPTAYARPVEAVIGVFSGLLGGISGAWGPPITFYLLARKTPPVDQVLTMGVSFLIGTLVLSGGLAVSGVLDRETLPLSLMGVVPVLLGMRLGLLLAPRLHPQTFRRATLAMLIFAGLNLLRRGLMG
jgi:uncharacterized membrane protein YfcA